MSDKIKEAFNTIKQAMADDPSYAYSWHCNIAMMCSDAIHSADITDENCMGEIHKTSNDAASRFMQLCFGVETKLKVNEPCEGCDSSPEDCEGVSNCDRLKAD